jgi:type 1 glutamine amidotransferase
VAWTNRYGDSGRAFYTSLGLRGDFENANFRDLLVNAIEWTTERN